MKTTVEALEGNKVKLLVEVDESEFDKAIDVAFRKLAREVRIPGFRPGKAPRRVLAARLGEEAGRSQALHDALPEYYAEAVRDHEVDVIDMPQIEITEGEDDGPLVFEAVVEVRPEVQVPGYASLRITIDSPEPAEADVDAQIERLRSQFGELVDADRSAVNGDYITIDISGSQDDEPIEQLTAEDFLYEVGSGGIQGAFPEVDEHVVGAKIGDIVGFEAADPRDESGESTIHLRVLVKNVQARVLPDLDDAFANEASEFETLDDLRADLRDRLASVRKGQAQMQLREHTGEALAALVEVDVPEALLRAEMQERANELQMRLEAQGLTIDQWAAITGKSPESFSDELRESAQTGVRVDLALRAVADAESMECTDEDIDVELARLAERLDLKLRDVRRQFERGNQIAALRSDLRKRKAFEWLIEQVEIVDDEGRPIDRAALEVDDDSDAESETETVEETHDEASDAKEDT